MVKGRWSRYGLKHVMRSLSAGPAYLNSVIRLYGNFNDTVMKLPDGTRKPVEFLQTLQLTVKPDKNIDDILERTFGGKNIGFIAEQIGETTTYNVHCYTIK